MKKIIYIFMSVVLIISVSACGKQNEVGNKIGSNEGETEYLSNKAELESSKDELALLQKDIEQVITDTSLSEEEKIKLVAQKEDEKKNIEKKIDELQIVSEQLISNANTNTAPTNAGQRIAAPILNTVQTTPDVASIAAPQTPTAAPQTPTAAPQTPTEEQTTARNISANGICGDNLTWSLNNNILTISGNGSIYDYSNSAPETVPWSSFKDTITDVIISEGVTKIGSISFSYSTALKNIIIPISVTSIGRQAFQGCASLKSINIPNNVSDIGVCVFGYCTSLQSIALPSALTVVPGALFLDCENLEEVKFNGQVEYISSGAFYECVKLQTILFPTSLISIDSDAFKDCNSLSELIIPSSVTNIGELAFGGCKNLKINCVAGSRAESYAKQYGISYKYIN